MEAIKLTKEDRIEAYKMILVDDEDFINSFLESEAGTDSQLSTKGE